MKDAVYVVFSATPYRIGYIIRKLTGTQYNHVSLALDEDLSRMYSFARRYYRTPLHGGFIRESLSRFHINGRSSACMICKIPVTVAQYYALEKQIDEMYAKKEQYLYNHLSVLTLPLRYRVQVQDARLCIEFVTDILSQLDTPVKKDRFYSIHDLMDILRQNTIYEGMMPTNINYQDDYFDPHPALQPFRTSIRDLFALLTRLNKLPKKPALK